MEMFNEVSKVKSRVTLLLVLMICMVSAGTAVSQEQQFEEIAVGFDIAKIMSRDIIVQYDGETIFVPLLEIFSDLGIHIDSDFDRQVFSGKYYIDNKPYEINLPKMKAMSPGKRIDLRQKDFVLSTTDLYLKVDLFYELFGLDVKFDFSTLRVTIPLDKDFPAYQRLQREKAHQSLLKEEIELTNVRRMPQRRDYIRGAVADWMISASPIGQNNVHYFDLNLGGMLLGGDFSVLGTGNTSTGIQTDNFKYNWHYYVNDNSFLTQAELGDVYSGGTFSRSMTGLKITNQPQVRRKYFQTIDITDHVGEGWEVELYVNNQLTDFQEADQNGDYHFVVDIYYGSSRIMLKLYGPNGEIKTEEKYVRVPYTLVPKSTFEYNFTTGQESHADSAKWYSQANGYFGVFNNLTVGFSADMPWGADTTEGSLVGTDITFQPTGDLSLNGSISPGYRMRGDLSFSKPSLISVSGSVIKYFENEVRNRANQERSYKLYLTSPLRIGQRNLALRYSISLDKYASTDAVSMNYGINTSLLRFHLSYMGNYKVSKLADYKTKTLTSKLMMTASLFSWMRPQFRIDYDHVDNELTSGAAYFTKRILRNSQISLSIVRNFTLKTNQVMLSFDFSTGFANFASRILRSGDQMSMSQIQRGSVRYNSGKRTIEFDRNNSVGYGAAVVKPFMDDNYNGVYDEGEEYMTDVNLEVSGLSGRQYGAQGNSTYDRLKPYQKYLVQVDPASLDNPMLKPVHENYEVMFNPNVVTSLEVPLALGSEVDGIVTRRTAKGTSGIGGIRVIFLNTSTESVTEVTTFNSGDYFFLGLLPGKYRAYVDPNQADKYGYTVEPKVREFEIEPIEGGTVIDNISFELLPKDKK